MRASIIIAQMEAGPSALTQKCVSTFIEHHGSAFELKVAHDEARNLYRTWNWAAEQSAGSVLVFLNNDTVTQGPWLDRLLQQLARNPECVAGVRTRTDPYLPHEVRRHTGKTFLAGWCLACHRETWAAQRFDERFELYFGDTDWLLRAGPQRLVPIESSTLTHLGHQSTKLRPDRRAVWQRDRETFVNKWS